MFEKLYVFLEKMPRIVGLPAVEISTLGSKPVRHNDARH
jgi:hypothetical protein